MRMTSSSNLIERLRTERSVYDAELADEAADEIERLQKRVSDADECIEEQEEMLEHLIVDQGQYEKEIERLRGSIADTNVVIAQVSAENERLQKRNALLEDVAVAAEGIEREMCRDNPFFPHHQAVLDALEALK